MPSNIEKVQEFIKEKEKNSILGQIKELTGDEESDNGNARDNDSDLMKYAEYKLKESELNIVEQAKLTLLELKLSVFKCTYFQEFQDFLEELKQNWWWATTEQNNGNTGRWTTDTTADISPEIADGNVEQIAHILSNWQSRSQWEKLEVSKEERKKFLFPNWELPKSQSEMESKYLSSITVPILDKNWNSSSIELKVHKKLANNYIAAFNELKNAWIKVNADATWAYNWRNVRWWTRLSDHSFWTAIDVNWTDNWWVYGATNTDSVFYNDQKTVEIFKKYWFARWWDRSKSSDDPMHFTYMGW